MLDDAVVLVMIKSLLWSRVVTCASHCGLPSVLKQGVPLSMTVLPSAAIGVAAHSLVVGGAGGSTAVPPKRRASSCWRVLLTLVMSPLPLMPFTRPEDVC